ncbi:hypothetical protein NPIL_468911 [Nephila pilipes]|uniref:Uncharacterized protein n=1 Tax=Nephila pilipes TaxID=299642 RepID=A0A8X6N1J1_NEPPI|nr:hypothetical protein NPIL_468911 [Nephila pilipes]
MYLDPQDQHIAIRFLKAINLTHFGLLIIVSAFDDLRHFYFCALSLTPSSPSAISFPGVTITDQTLAFPPPSCLSTETDMDYANIPDVSAHEDPPESLQMDDSPLLPPAHTQQPPTKNPKKKPSFG